MSVPVALLVFTCCLVATLAASDLLVRGLDRLGARLGLSEGLLGLLTALGADAPEISSALAALHAGARDVGVGVVLGSNIFNLAALLGLGAVLAGGVQARREGLLLDGGVALLVTLIGGALVAGALPPGAAALLLATLFIPYAAVLGLPPRRIAHLALPPALRTGLALAVGEVDVEAAEDPRVALAAGPSRAILLIPPALVVIVGGSAGMVAAALTLAAAWQVPQGLVGGIVLAALTSLPNAYAAARLALQQRGAAVVSETLNSNTINLLAGLALPAVILGGTTAGAHGGISLLWLLGMTAVTLALLLRPAGLTRRGGAALIVAYALYVALRVAQQGL